MSGFRVFKDNRKSKFELFVYEVTYRGFFTGGVAIAMARDEAHAEQLVKEHTTTHNFTEIEVALLPIEPGGSVLWNWTGKVDTGDIDADTDS